ncbi:phosphotransferase [Spongiactinospora sp. 9N601]|uniref:phosphotransferase n=1 Tax=Spongiactinospora sp. 9N601 TaxID=3375149 RepID=UPI00378B516A
MRDAPHLPDETIRETLDAHFGLRPTTLEFLPLGNDSASWSFRADDHFLKVRAGDGHMPGAAVPALLSDIPHVLAPIRTIDGRPYATVNGFALALYPLLDAAPAVEVGMSAEHWRTIGEAISRLHATPLTPELIQAADRETYRPGRRELIPAIETALRTPQDDIVKELATHWAARQEIIDGLLRRTDTMGPRLAAEEPPVVLTHGDLHTWNILIDDQNNLWIIDWDEAAVAPRERDLMLVIKGIGPGLVSEDDTAAFFQGYGESTVPDERLLSFYRAGWAVRDIAEFGERVVLDPRLSDAARQDAVEGFLSLFEPGDIVEIAG